MENPETPRGKPGELTPGDPTTAEAARVSLLELPALVRRGKNPDGSPRDSDAEFAAVIAAIHQFSVPSPPAAGSSGTRSRSRRDRTNIL
jgi:hypothetical protein